jgi:hypothetical protein
MAEQRMSLDVMEYMVWVVEIASAEFFSKDKTAAYDALIKSGLWDIYVEHYDVTHTLGAEYLLEEMREYFPANGVVLPC